MEKDELERLIEKVGVGSRMANRLRRGRDEIESESRTGAASSLGHGADRLDDSPVPTL
jgi:hypothetical protein